MKQLKVMLWYDVEDFITPEADDALLALIEMMDSLGIRSSLKIVAEKIRVLKKRGREDILEKIAGHEVCYHTENHSIPPTQTEYLQHMGFAEGAAEFERREKQGFADVRDIAGQFPTSYGQPGGSWAPHVFPVLKKWGIPTYLDSHYILSVEEGPFYYGGILNLTRLWSTMRVDFDDADGMAKAKERFLQIEKRAGELQLVSIYYHPCEFSCTEFWDGVNFRRGANPPREEWKGAPLRTKEEMMRRVNMLGEFLRWTLEMPNVEYITAAQSCAYEITDPLPLTAEDIRTAAQTLTAGPDYYRRGNRTFCASEMLSLWARQILGLHRIPEFAYGPEADVPSVIVQEVAPAALARAVMAQYDRVLGFKQLPRLYQVGENRLNCVDMFMNLQRAVAEDIPADQPMTLCAGEGTLVPQKHINTSYDWAKNWVIFPEGLNTADLVRHAKLQTWTLKPAIF